MGRQVEARTRYQKHAEVDPKSGQPRGFRTPTRKMEFYGTRLARASYAPLPMYQDQVASPASDAEMAQEYPLVLTFSRLV